jgi:hypothetical protein
MGCDEVSEVRLRLNRLVRELAGGRAEEEEAAPPSRC